MLSLGRSYEPVLFLFSGSRWKHDTGYWILDTEIQGYMILDLNTLSSSHHQSIQHPASNIQHPASSIQHPVSSIRRYPHLVSIFSVTLKNLHTMHWRKFNGDPIELPIKTAVETAIQRETHAGYKLKVCIGTDSQVKGVET